jgi:hypothetical protein
VAALVLALPGLALVAAPTVPPPRCAVERSAVAEPLPGLYTVTLRTVSTCPPGGYARVRLQSGRVYPWREVKPGRPAVYKGVPWYWRGGWEAASGRVYQFEIPGLVSPWGGR